MKLRTILDGTPDTSRVHTTLEKVSRLPREQRLHGITEEIRVDAEIPQLLYLQSACAVLDPPLFHESTLHYIMCGGLLRDLDATAWAEKLNQGLRVVYAATEVGRATSPGNVHTQASKGPDGWVLNTPDDNACKFVTLPSDGGPCVGVVFAQVPGEGTYPFATMLVTENGLAPGVSISPPMSMPSVPLLYSTVRFTDTPVEWITTGITPETDPLPVKDRLPRALGSVRLLYVSLASALSAVARSSAVAVSGFARHRDTASTGMPIIEDTAYRNLVIGALADSFAMSCVSHVARTRWANLASGASSTRGDAGPWRSIGGDLALIKAVCAETAETVTSLGVRLSGVHGHLDANRMMAWNGLTKAFLSAGGDTRLIFQDHGSEPVPGYLTDTWWGKTLSTHVRFSGDPYEAGRARAEMLVSDAVRTVVRTVDPKDRVIMDFLGRLYEARRIQDMCGSLLLSGALTKNGARENQANIRYLCDQIAPHLTHLCELLAPWGSDVPMRGAQYPGVLTPKVS